MLKRYPKTIIGVIFGSVAGYLYYKWVGCVSGTCAITSNPINSTLYGAAMGALLGNLFEKKVNNNNN